MTKPDTLDLDAMKKIAKAATPGPWSVWQHDDARLRFVSDGQGNIADELGPEDAAHIAAFDPPTVLALIEAARERDALKAALEKMADVIEPHWRAAGNLLKTEWLLNVYIDVSGKYDDAEDKLAVVTAERDRLKAELTKAYGDMDATMEGFEKLCAHSDKIDEELATARAHMRQAVEALKPFAALAGKFRVPDDKAVWGFDGVEISAGQFSHAHSALTSLTAALGDHPPAPASREEGT